ncbi:hypothetical protein VNO77_02934 [Canavalia gladiata]|uniref:Uncharacterized protein n=1 Tax=Canavalia gladiata TaxID=3824 RepID=A0AAN9MUM6_CANGL
MPEHKLISVYGDTKVISTVVPTSSLAKMEFPVSTIARPTAFGQLGLKRNRTSQTETICQRRLLILNIKPFNIVIGVVKQDLSLGVSPLHHQIWDHVNALLLMTCARVSMSRTGCPQGLPILFKQIESLNELLPPCVRIAKDAELLPPLYEPKLKCEQSAPKACKLFEITTVGSSLHVSTFSVDYPIRTTKIRV